MAAVGNNPDEVFEQCYRCYPVSFIDKGHLEKGDKIIMPPSALDRLASMHIDYPILFKLQVPSTGMNTHCGVLEFTAEEGLIYLPYWMMQNMVLEEGDIAQLRNTSLLKGTYVKLQPHTTDFLDISDPKAILETSLRNYSCLTTGDTIVVPYNNKKYYIDIVETKPSAAVSIIETDCEVDFAPPLDYKEPEKPKPSSQSKKREPEVQEEPAAKIPKFCPFTGSGRRLDGKPSEQPTGLSTCPVVKQETSVKNELNGHNPSSPVVKQEPLVKNEINGPNPCSIPRRKCGRLLFSSSSKQPQNHTTKLPQNKVADEQQQKVEEQKFKAFTGKKYSLKD